MVSPDQKEMFDVLEKQRQHQLRVDRVLKIVLPIVAFLLMVICANMNVWSTIFTFIVLWVAFYAVGIKRLPLWHWLIVIVVYCLIDNILSYGSFNQSGFSRQFGAMFIFLGIVGVGRRYFDRWLMKE
ncbi:MULTISPECIES: hypothetical protein [Acinetobacter]|jgi:hypothetical protein|uniref:hypothetical protein n=1 Tax=Acinetobacter TaxID=469 RepID=UPI001445E223|nr:MULTISPECIES: hypothetical protein [Acinetobacter]NLN57081.1 hypothetical protein [Gammaproteobacteria bacterium]MBF4519867.1 hypothetical protein [Acinetobacter towneri]MDM1486440.1 hypothetical protein [Acinetobacter towneri]MEB6565385.1 hypothetical protein [Acinetobacter towneri]HRO79271.1 hypothetical protein [Acinetobacter towneri]